MFEHDDNQLNQQHYSRFVQEDTREACRGAFGPLCPTKTLYNIFEHDDNQLNQQSYSRFANTCVLISHLFLNIPLISRYVYYHYIPYICVDNIITAKTQYIKDTVPRRHSTSKIRYTKGGYLDTPPPEGGHLKNCLKLKRHVLVFKVDFNPKPWFGVEKLRTIKTARFCGRVLFGCESIRFTSKKLKSFLLL